jgi:hypothetical protein
MLGGHFVKPIKALSADDALTPDFYNELNSYFDDMEKTYRTKEEYEAKNYTLENAFEVEDEELEESPEKREYRDNLYFVGYAPVTILKELSGTNIRSVSEYVKAVGKYLKTSPLDERQERAILKCINFKYRDLFLKWLCYEFMRTEDYNHLKECLKEYRKFLLPKKWEKGLIYLHIEPELFVLSYYLSMEVLSYLKRDQLRQIAEATNTPYSLIIKASKEKRWEF